jgi:hypothetical protein
MIFYNSHLNYKRKIMSFSFFPLNLLKFSLNRRLALQGHLSTRLTKYLEKKILVSLENVVFDCIENL